MAGVGQFAGAGKGFPLQLVGDRGSVPRDGPMEDDGVNLPTKPRACTACFLIGLAHFVPGPTSITCREYAQGAADARGAARD